MKSSTHIENLIEYRGEQLICLVRTKEENKEEREKRKEIEREWERVGEREGEKRGKHNRHCRQDL